MEIQSGVNEECGKSGKHFALLHCMENEKRVGVWSVGNGKCRVWKIGSLVKKWKTKNVEIGKCGTCRQKLKADFLANY